MAITHKQIRDLAAGDRVCWHATPDKRGAWGTVTGVNEVHSVPGVNGPVFTGITVTLECAHYPTFDGSGWPADERRTVTRRFNQLTAYEVEYAYTPDSN